MERAPKHVSWLSMHLRMPSGLWSDVQVLQNNGPPQQRLIFKWFDCTKGLQFHPTLQHPMLFLFFGHHLHYSEPLGAHFSFWYIPLHFSCSPSLFHMLWIVHRSGLARVRAEKTSARLGPHLTSPSWDAARLVKLVKLGDVAYKNVILDASNVFCMLQK